MWKESAGREYMVDGRKETSTDITFTLDLHREGDTKPLLEFDIDSSLPSQFFTADLYDSAIKSVTDDDRFQDLGALVGGALGIKSSSDALFRISMWEGSAAVAKEILRRNGWTPAKPAQEAMAHLAADEPRKCIPLGKAAVAIMLTYINRHENSGQVEDHLKALGEISDPRVLQYFQSKLGRASDMDYMGTLPIILEILERIDDGGSLPELEKLAALKPMSEMKEDELTAEFIDDDVLKSVKKAIQGIRSRLKK